MIWICPGSTPAHAGNTPPLISQTDGLPVYPRPRGEYVSLRISATLHSGLPPPTRGILATAINGDLRRGSTPAHAGNTSARCGGAV